MGRTVLDISVSLDGFVAGPNPSLELPLGEGGELLHDWVVGLAAWRERHGLAGGEETAGSELVAASVARTGAVVMGRRMFSGGGGAWENDRKADGWWGDEPPFRVPVFVVTHHPREALVRQGGTTFTFVTDGVESAVEEARAAAGEKDVSIAGGASVAQQALGAGLLDEMLIHLVPVLLGSGTRLFDAGTLARLECTQVLDAAGATHIRYDVLPVGNTATVRED